MEYTLENIALILGDKYNPTSEYVIETHRGATNKFLSGGWVPVGQVKDSTQNDSGTMVIMEKTTKPKTEGA